MSKIEAYLDRRMQTVCLMAIVFVQFQEHWKGHFWGFGGGIALLTCLTWVYLPSVITEWTQGKTNFPRERIMPETAPNDQPNKADGSEIP
jgi:hypothetical protein